MVEAITMKLIGLTNLTKEQLEDAVHRLQGRLEGRMAMNLRTAELHSDRDTKRQAEARVLAYQTALGDLETCFTASK
jgi:hypothetical protein